MIKKFKILNFYLPIFLTVVLIVVTALFWYRAQRTVQPLTIYQTDDGYAVQMLSSLADSGQAQVLMSKNSPKVVLSKWDGQASLTVSYGQAGNQVSKITSKGQSMVEWRGQGQSLQAYPLKPTVEMEDGGMEIQVKLDQKPQDNKFDFSVSGSEGMNFYYQAPLNEDFANHKASPHAVSCTETQCFDKDGNQVTYRPENVVGSYSVYSKNLKNHEIGGTNFSNGKLFQIYRPKAIDANGNETWATLAYDDSHGTLSVTVPQDFLDTASYPVIVDPTYGYTSLGATEDSTDDFRVAYKVGAFSGPTGSVISGAHWYGRRSSTGSTSIYVALYSDTGSAPGTKLDEIAIPANLTTTLTSYSTTGGSYSGLTNGTSYWIAMASGLAPSSNGWKNEYDTAGALGTSYMGGGQVGSNPSTWSQNGAIGPWNLSAYFDYGNPTKGTATKGGKYRQVGGKMIIN